MLFSNFPAAFSVEESDFLDNHFSGQSGLNFNAHLIHTLMENRVALLNDLCTASTKTLVEQMFINKI